ncbi:MAG: peptidylprolyl isomerase [Gammaproteobacteria bacterium]|nr:peptidylprolyl isomerase [Gammaproteobacteria bacterium]
MKLYPSLVAVTALSTLLLTSSPVVAGDEVKVLASVNGVEITQPQLQQFMAINYASQPQKPSETDALEEAIRHELLRQEADKKGLAKEAPFLLQLEEIRSRLIVSYALNRYLEEHPVTDEQLQQEYDSRKEEMRRTEYKASHILLETEEEAKEVIAKLDGGGDFAELAKEFSTGPTGKSGGDLGWFAPKQMVPPFSEAVVALEDKAYSREPVKTQFGWHVIYRDGTRTTEPPAMAMLKGQLTKVMKQKQITDYLQQLDSQAKVERF